MFSFSQAMTQTPPVPTVIDTSGRWLSDQDDMALGCECADPALQIDRWRQEAILQGASAA